MLDNQKLKIRIINDNFDEEIEDNINAAKADLTAAGINVDKKVTVQVDVTPEPSEEDPTPEQVIREDEVMDPLIKQAISAYCKAYFGLNNPEAERWERVYNSLKTYLALVGDYSAV